MHFVGLCVYCTLVLSRRWCVQLPDVRNWGWDERRPDTVTEKLAMVAGVKMSFWLTVILCATVPARQLLLCGDEFVCVGGDS
jgi:hypothetical protein